MPRELKLGSYEKDRGDKRSARGASNLPVGRLVSPTNVMPRSIPLPVPLLLNQLSVLGGAQSELKQDQVSCSRLPNRSIVIFALWHESACNFQWKSCHLPLSVKVSAPNDFFILISVQSTKGDAALKRRITSFAISDDL